MIYIVRVKESRRLKRIYLHIIVQKEVFKLSLRTTDKSKDLDKPINGGSNIKLN